MINYRKIRDSVWIVYENAGLLGYVEHSNEGFRVLRTERVFPSLRLACKYLYQGDITDQLTLQRKGECNVAVIRSASA